MVFGIRKGAARKAVAAGLAGLLVLAACSSDGGSTTSGSTGGTSGGGSTDKALLIARGMDVNSLDPSRAYCDTCQIFMTAV
jgi:hypothetical protein